MQERRIPRTMSTQHPDNANVPSWCNGEIIQGEDEVYEVFWAYSQLGCQEVMWDSEGKDVDTRVVRKLLSRFREFFEENVLGESFFLTYRIPNPRIQVTERKIVVETLMNILVGCDVASAFYRRLVVPIFEVILPLTTKGYELMALYNYYRKVIAGNDGLSLDEDLTVESWVGSSNPKAIEIIPLIEDWDSLLRADKIVEPYVKSAKPRYVRVFLARSDPALNYGLIPAVLLAKFALSRLRVFQTKMEVPIYPIIGVGSMPFRGHLSPGNLRNFLREYRGVYTITIQSALKYDYEQDTVKKTVQILNDALPYGEAESLCGMEDLFISTMSKLRIVYQEVIEKISPLINDLSAYIPPRRARRLHIGLFGYSRGWKGISLPRAIPFAAALYTLGIPPEFIGLRGLDELSEEEWEIVETCYLNLVNDLRSVSGYVSWRNIEMLKDFSREIGRIVGLSEEDLRLAVDHLKRDLEHAENVLGLNLGPRSLTERRYENTVNDFLISYIERKDEARKHVVEAARIRRCLG